MAEVRRTVADSPWLWACIFFAAAGVGSLVIARKFDVRQRQVEGRFLGRQQAALERQRRAAGLEPIDLAETATSRDEAAPDRIVPLWTLVTAAGAAAAGSAAMLWREQRSSAARGGPPPA